jgi:hypothetical protein
MNEYNCLNCEYKSTKLTLINIHQKIHKFGRNAIFQCFPCNKRIANYGSFCVHLSRDHKNPQKYTSNSEDYICSNCFFKTKCFAVHLSHLRSHLRKKEAIHCTICKQIFQNLSSFQSHVRRKHKHSVHSNINDTSNTILNPLPESTKSPERDVAEPTTESNHFDYNEKQKQLAVFFMKLKAKYCVTDEVIQFFVDEMTELVKSLHNSINFSIENYPITISPELLVSLDNIFQNHSLSNFSTKFKRDKFIRKNFDIIDPIQICLGKNKVHEERYYHYIPIQDSLKAFLEDPQVNKLLLQTKSKKPGHLTDYNDGSYYQNNSFFNSSTMRIEILLFCDAFQGCNPLGTAKSKHKLHGLQFMVGNLDSKLRSQIDNILLLALIKDVDVKEFGMNGILKPIISDLKKLETEGIEIKNIGNIKGSILFICGDNLGSHQLGGFIENFSKPANNCRYCSYHSSALLSKDVDIKELRTEESYSENVAEAELIGGNSCGVKFNSVFNELNHFHVVKGLPPCLGHDWFQGVVSRDLLLILKFLIKEGIFTENFLNESLKKISKSSKSKIKFANIKVNKNRLPGSMSEIRNLVTCLPLIFLEIPITDKNMNIFCFFSTLVEITRIITSPEINKSKISYLQSLIREYFFYRKEAFPTANLTPKHHYIVHYPDLIMKFGPLSMLWTFRFESKHKYFKYIIENSKNFINLTKLIAGRHQMLQACLINDRFPRFNVISNTVPCSFSDTLLDIDLSSEFKFWSTDIKLHNTRFRSGDKIVVSYDDETSHIKVLEIQDIYINDNFSEVLFSGKQMSMSYSQCNNLYVEILDSEITLIQAFSSKILSVKPEFIHAHKGINYLSTFTCLKKFDWNESELAYVNREVSNQNVSILNTK